MTHVPVVGLHIQVYNDICRYSLLAAVLVMVVGEAVSVVMVPVELKAMGVVLLDVVVVAGVVLIVAPWCVSAIKKIIIFILIAWVLYFSQ